MKLWDAAFSAVHEHDPSEEHCIYTQQAIDAAMSKHRKLEFPVTHKTHCMKKACRRANEESERGHREND